MHQIGKLVAEIVGLGGVGNTTVAKVSYGVSCFLFDVKGKGLQLHLQSKLLKSLIGLDSLKGPVDKGIEILKRCLSSSEALMILDDVDQVDHFDTV